MTVPTARASTTPAPTADPSGPIVPADVMASNVTPEPVRAIAAGFDMCAIRQDRTIGCWGDNSGHPPSGKFVALDSGVASTCGIRENGRPACWGDIGSKVPTGTYRTLSVGAGYACAIRSANAALVCWSASKGLNIDEVAAWESVRPPKGRFTTSSVGDVFACAIRTNGKLVCWGNEVGEVPPAPDDRVVALDVPCAIVIGGVVTCFGWPDGEDETAAWLSPPVDGTFTAVSAAPIGDLGCALRDDGAIRCWRTEPDEDISDPDEDISDPDEHSSFPVRGPTGTFAAVTVGSSFACVTRPDHTAVCWGDDDDAARPAPTPWLDAPPFETDRTIRLRWGAYPAFGAIATYDVERATGFDAYGSTTSTRPWHIATSATADTVEGKPGERYCWRVRARDSYGRTSDWAERCTSIPDDDSVFTRSAGWSTVLGSRYFDGRATTTTERGATLTIDVGTPGLALFATTCPSCGTIQVIVGGEVQDTISLESNDTADRSLVWEGDNDEDGYYTDAESGWEGDNDEEGYYTDAESGQDGHIVVEVVSSGRPVTIDALAQGPSLDQED